jgi:putative phosphoribosyl transferase
MPHLFRNRREAGRQLGARLATRSYDDVVVLGLPRGGVPVAYEVAAALKAPLDIFVVRKLGVPRQKELAMGAIALGGVRVFNREVVDEFRIPPETIEAVTAVERIELDRRVREYRGDRAFPALAGCTVVLVDDGVATGASMRAAIHAVRTLKPLRVVAAAPVMSTEAHGALCGEADSVEAVAVPEPFFGVGAWYDDFTQTSDEEVRVLLRSADARTTHPTAR